VWLWEVYGERRRVWNVNWGFNRLEVCLGVCWVRVVDVTMTLRAST
jgi:hypothetical protein